DGRRVPGHERRRRQRPPTRVSRYISRMPAGPLRFDATEVREVLRMIESESESLDVRAVTMGVSLRDTASEDLDRTCGRIYDKLMRAAERLVPTTKAVHADFAVPITSTRLSVTPLALVTEP